MTPDLVLTNARVVTMAGRTDAPAAVAVRAGRIAWIGTSEEAARLTGARTRIIDCLGRTLLPGLIDAHLHLLAYASSLVAVDCSPYSTCSIGQIRQALGRRARETPAGEWIRGYGYDDLSLLERRHPTRRDLDAATPAHPVRLNHRSGHAAVLNSLALDRVGIGADTPDPVDGVIDRDDDGEPTGLLFEMDGYLGERVPSLTDEQLRRGVSAVSCDLLSQGITSVHDATHLNSMERWTTIEEMKRSGLLAPRVTMMPGLARLDGFRDAGIGYGSGGDHLSLGHVKLMLTGTTGGLYPDRETLAGQVAEAHSKGFPVAIHAVESDGVEAATASLLEGSGGRRPAAPPDRIEHCFECPPETLRRLSASGIVPVVQPGLVYRRGDVYLSETAPAVLPWLHRTGSLFGAGLCPAAGSDAPVVRPRPFEAVYSAVTRRSSTGAAVNDSERVSVYDALRMYTVNAARAGGHERDRGSIEVGKLADLVLLDRDPLTVPPEELPDVRVTTTILDGRVVWEA